MLLSPVKGRLHDGQAAGRGDGKLSAESSLVRHGSWLCCIADASSNHRVQSNKFDSPPSYVLVAESDECPPRAHPASLLGEATGHPAKVPQDWLQSNTDLDVSGFRQPHTSTNVTLREQTRDKTLMGVQLIHIISPASTYQHRVQGQPDEESDSVPHQRTSGVSKCSWTGYLYTHIRCAKIDQIFDKTLSV
ncbi:hypothetical protein CCM_07920 [Cordyceps militaris CM01]|uniref:Uncharacterized protein n=1 Tax=Cordyceps militaris (strain CM01) TaxID=983644 RepID=G3JP58_CORMM|nr:uncharacterized protein CCM_07920 [Cordyceps militaris CM01]EGX89668.1 hypothetical protein CCM_07920 [Cordyceps militaris CM01]